MSGNSWLEQLETRLEQQLEAFLRANPAQEALLQEQEQRDQQRQLKQQRQQLQAQAELLRADLLDLAAQINQWQGRVQRARGANAHDLAERAEAHLQALMAQGRDRWQSLSALGQTFARVDEQLQDLARREGASPGCTGTEGVRATPATAVPLEQAWAAFEAEQELEAMRQRQQR